jgi:hypothetical protein
MGNEVADKLGNKIDLLRDFLEQISQQHNDSLTDLGSYRQQLMTTLASPAGYQDLLTFSPKVWEGEIPEVGRTATRPFVQFERVEINPSKLEDTLVKMRGTQNTLAAALAVAKQGSS